MPGRFLLSYFPSTCVTMVLAICIDFFQVRECLEDDIGLSYRGKVNITESGITCQDWSSQSPQKHDYRVIVYSYNYCRNLELDVLKPWCYTIDKYVRWQYCDIPLCGK